MGDGGGEGDVRATRVGWGRILGAGVLGLGEWVEDGGFRAREESGIGGE